MSSRAHVVHVITQLEHGGAQLNTLFTLEHLDPGEFRRSLVVGRPGRLDARARRLPGVEVTAVPSLVRALHPLHDPRALAALTALLRRVRRTSALPVIVHTHSSKAGILGRLAARLAGVRRVVHSYHGFGFHDEQPAPLRAALVASERAVRPLTDRFLCVSEANRSRGRALGILDAERTRLVRSGIVLSDFAPREGRRERARRALDLAPETPVIGMVACMKPQKAPLDFVAVCTRVRRAVPGLVALLVGDGALRPDVERAIRAAGLEGSLRLLGWRDDVPEILAALDVAVLTSRWEGLPRAIPEAQAAGVPIVATAVDGSAEAIEPGRTGFLCPPGDVGGLAAAVTALLGDPERCRQIGAEASASVGAFDAFAMVRAQEELYRELLTGGPAAHE